MQDKHPKQCGAKTRSGTPCKTPAMENGRCRMHGGKSLRGIASPTLKTGKYSRYLPEHLLEAYKDVQADETLLSVRGDIELLDVLIRSKLENLESGDSAAHWDFVLKQVVKANKAYKSDDYGGLMSALDEIEALAEGRRLHYATEQEIVSQLDQRRKLVETEQKILLQGERAITAEQAMLLVSALLDSVRRNVSDANALNTIQTDFIQYVGGANQQRLNSG